MSDELAAAAHDGRPSTETAERPSRAMRKHLRHDKPRRGRPPREPAPAAAAIAPTPATVITPAPRWNQAAEWIHDSYVVPIHERYNLAPPTAVNIAVVLDALQATVEKHLPALPSDPAVTLLAVSVVTFGPLAVAIYRESRASAAPPTPAPTTPAGANPPARPAAPWDALAKKDGAA